MRSFPIFDSSYSDKQDWNYRGCGCNTLFYADTNCTGLSRAENYSAARADYASWQLNVTTRSLQSAATVLLLACPSDTSLLETLAFRLHQPNLLSITFGKEKPDPARLVVPWTFPQTFGYQKGSTDMTWPLSMLEVNALRIRDTQAVTITNFPPAVEKMSGLRTVYLVRLGLTRVPLGLRQLAGGLKFLQLSENKLTSLPGWIAEMKLLNLLHVAGNLFSKVPRSIGDLSSLKFLDFHDTGLISTVPSFIGKLTMLRYVYRLELFLRQ